MTVLDMLDYRALADKISAISLDTGWKCALGIKGFNHSHGNKVDVDFGKMKIEARDFDITTEALES